MPKISIFNIGKANAEINAGHEAADSILASAKISTLKVDGKDVAASDAPLAVKIAAVGALVTTGDKTQDVSELIASNGQIAAQVETLTGENTVLKATQAAHVQKISTLEAELTTQKASVTELTASNTELTNRLTASNAEATRQTGLVNAANRKISEFCITADCLALNDKDGKPFAKDAKSEDKLEAADKLPVAEKLVSLFGAVNAAVAKTGVSFAALPAGGTGSAQAVNKPMSATELCAAAVAAKTAGKSPVAYQSPGK